MTSKRQEFDSPVWAGLILKNRDGSMWLIQIDNPEATVTIEANTDDYDMYDFLARTPPRVRMTAEVHMTGTVPQYEYHYGPNPEWIKETPELEQAQREIES